MATRGPEYTVVHLFLDNRDRLRKPDLRVPESQGLRGSALATTPFQIRQPESVAVSRSVRPAGAPTPRGSTIISELLPCGSA